MSESRPQGIGLFRALAAQLPDPLLLLDAARRVHHANPAAEALTGRPLHGASLAELLPGLDPLQVEGPVETRLELGADSRLVEVSVTPVDVDGAAWTLLSLREATQRRRQEEAERQRQRLEAIGILTGGIAHDFNNILAAAIGFIDLARKQVEGDTQLARDLETVAETHLRARRLIRQILRFARPTDEPRVPLDMIQVVTQCTQLLRATLPSTVEVSWTPPPDLPAVVTEVTQIQQVLLNLGTNAAHAMRGTGGTLTLGAARRALAPDDARVTETVPPGEYVRLTVGDTGEGIPEHLVGQIFDPFFTTKGTGGTGLGLSVVRDIMEGHGGFMDVDSTPGSGTLFSLYFPASPVRARPTSEEVPGRDEVLGSQRVLFVDDEPELGRAVERGLVELGYRVQAHASGEAALAAFRERPHDYDILVTDYTMPGMTGLELGRQVHKVRPELPILLCTGHSDHLVRAELAEVNVGSVVQKPLRFDELSRSIQAAVDQGAASSSSSA